MDANEKELMAEWIDQTSTKILSEMGVQYKKLTGNLPDTDINLIYHALLCEAVFYKFFMSILESVSDDCKDSQMEEMITNMRKFRAHVRDEEVMWKILEKKAQ